MSVAFFFLTFFFMIPIAMVQSLASFVGIRKYAPFLKVIIDDVRENIFLQCYSMNLQGWDAMIAIGFNAAISLRVSNELGAGNYRQAKISVTVVSVTSVAIGFLAMLVVLATRDSFPFLFTSSDAVAQETTRISILLAFTILLNSLQPVLSGVAIGAGWQSLVAYINIACYYLFGQPAGIILGFNYGLGGMGVWGGMIGGICLQTAIMIVVTAFTNWKKEITVTVMEMVIIAEKQIKQSK